MKKQNFLKSAFCLLLGLVCHVAWAQSTATIEVSTSVDAPENMYEIKSSAGHWMTSFTSPSGTIRGCFAFFDDGDANTTDAYKIYSATHQQWVSYTKAASYSGGVNKVVLVDSQEDANAWNATTATVSEVVYYQFAPYTDGGTVAAMYWNWYGGTGSNPYNNVEKTVGFYSTGASGDGGSRWLLSKVTELATEEAVAEVQTVVAEKVGYPRADAGVSVLFNYMLQSGVASSTSLSNTVSAYKTSSDILLPEDGKAYTFTSVMGEAADATKYYMKYVNGQKVSVSKTESDASVFVCKELRTGVYAFITSDGHILTWVGNNELGAYKENNNIYGYSSNYATEYNGKSDWNEITVKKNGTAEKDLGYLRLVGRRSSTAVSSFIANTNNRFDQAGDGYWFNATNSSAWIVTEVTHTHTDAQTLALAKIDAKVAVAGNAAKLGEGIGYVHYIIGGDKVSDVAAINAAIDAATTTDEVDAIKNSYAVTLPECGKYYRIKSNASGNYLDAVNCYSGDQMGLKSETEYSPTGTIFYLDSENRLRNFATETYIYGTRHIGTANTSEKNAWTFAASARTVGCLTLTSNSSASQQLHDSGGNRADRCGSICGERHDFIIEEVTELPRHGETYYIYSDTYQNGAFVNRYFYVNSSNALAMNAALATEAAYKWTCTVTDDGYIQFQNGNGRYLSHRGVSDTPYNFTLKKGNTHHGVVASLYSVAADRYFVVNNDGTGFNQANRTYNQTTENYCTDFVFLPINEVKVLTIDGNSKVGATATWNGETKNIPATWVVTPQTEITDATLSVTSPAAYTFSGLYENSESVGETIEIASVDADRTITAQFSPAFFSTIYGDKWVSINRASNAAHVAILGSAASGTIPTFNTIDYANEGILWCFVGNAENFKIYNKVSGDALALTPSNTPANGVTVQMTAAADAQSWHLIEYNDGYAIAPVGNTSFGINSYTGAAGSQIKFYGVGDSGTHWNFNLMDITKPLTFSVEVDQVWESSPRVAELTLTIDGASSQTRILGDVDAKKMYLPVGATFSLSSMTYRGYTFNGFDGEDSYEDATLPEGGLEVTASYIANEERTLFYSPRDGHPYRIPAIATAPNGDIFAICDYRPCGNDIGYGEVDLVCRMSSDNGVTWTEEKMIADGQGDAYAANDTSLIWQVGFGDPAIVADRESNKILVMSVCGNQTCWDGTFGDTDPNPNRVARLYIEHDGEKWVYGEPEEVTYDVYPKFVDEEGNVHAASLFIGAGKICQSRVVKKGDYYRLYCAVWNVTKTQRQHHNYVIYSDDFGQTWEVLGDLGYENSPAPYGNEPKCEELPDGTVVLSSRVSGGRYFNLFTFDNEGKSEKEMYTTGSWGEVAKSTQTYDGSSQGTNGEIYKVKAIRKSDGQICDVMLQSIPAGPGRTNVKVYYKEMVYGDNDTNVYTPATFAEGWTVGKHVSTKDACYSTMILQKDGRIGFFFEEVPGGYCMVYIPYTLEDLTGGQYSLYTVTSTITDVEIGTFYASEAMQIPEGVKAYVADSDPADGIITMKRLEEGIIPAHTGAVLRGAADDYEFIPSISYGTPVEGNLLVGHEGTTNKADDRLSVVVGDDASASIYVLANDSEGAKFYKKSADFTVKNNKAYLRVPNVALAQGLRIRFAGEEEGDDSTTGIEGLESADHRPQSTVFYDLSGRRVLNPTKGVYIMNGKKVVK